jgi:EAL domain-containing protein (putative c-di-GMP-specific phosphodiesterase class I)
MVKVDGSFVKGLAESRDNQIFVSTLVHLAKNFDLSTVAEWVGNEKEADILRGFGVDYFQGFCFGKPDAR